jgi:hypothetical protein
MEDEEGIEEEEEEDDESDDEKAGYTDNSIIDHSLLPSIKRSDVFDDSYF